MRILITGAAGFIGSHLAEHMEAAGHDVVGVDNLETGRRSNWQGDLRVENIADRNALYGIANQVKPGLVVHCAASYTNPDFWHRDTDTNVTGTINATIAAAYHGAKIVYFQTALPPVSSYAISKTAGLHYVQMHPDHLVFRLANIYGPRNVSGPIPTFYKRISEGLACKVVDTTRDIVHISDLIGCVTGALDRNLTGVFDVCSGEQTTILSMYEAVAAELGDDAAADIVPPATDDVQTLVDPANGVPAWQPTVGFADGVRTAVDWYRTHGVTETFTHLKLGEAHGAAA